MGMFIFVVCFVASLCWIFKLLKPIVFLINNEAVMYNLHNPLNFNLVKIQSAMMITSAIFGFLTSLLSFLLLFDIAQLQGIFPLLSLLILILLSSESVAPCLSLVHIDKCIRANRLHLLEHLDSIGRSGFLPYLCLSLLHRQA